MKKYIHIFQEMHKFGSSATQYDLLYLAVPNVHVENLSWPPDLWRGNSMSYKTRGGQQIGNSV